MTGDGEAFLRLAIYFGVLAVMAGLEAWRPRRPRGQSRWRRWPGNLGIAALNTILVRILFTTMAVDLAFAAEARGWGLLHMLAWPGWIEFAIALVVFDLVIYAQHVLFHQVPVLWRLHRMHHADTDLDVTSGARFHPVEIALSMLIKLAVIPLLGPSAAAVVIFAVVLNATAMFNHANLALPAGLDRVLRWFVVTPDMHRVHHSVVMAETNSNYGFNLPWWDRLFGTYRAAPRAGHDGMTIGLGEFRDPGEQRLDRLLSQPFRRA